MKLIHILSRNIRFSFLERVVSFGILLALLPYIISKVGHEVYGAYVLVLAFTGYLSVLDLGMSAAVIKYVAEYLARGDRERIRAVVSATFSFYVLIGLVAGSLLMVMSVCFPYFFAVAPENVPVIRTLFWISAAASLFIWPGRTFEGVLQGLQRYDWLSGLNAAATLLTAGAAVVVFENGLGMTWFLAVSCGIIVLKYAGAALIGMVVLLRIGLRFPYLDGDVYRKVFSFSFFVFLGNLVNILVFHFDDIVVGAFISVAAVTLYKVAYTVQNGFRMVHGLICGPILPACADLVGRGDFTGQKTLLLRGTKYVSLVMVPLVIITIVFAPRLVPAWMGAGFESSVILAQCLVLFWIFNGILGVAGTMLMARGFVKTLFKIAGLNAIVNLVLSLVLVQYLGVLGVALGTVIPMICLNFPLVLSHALKVFEVSFSEFFSTSVRPNLAVYLFAVVGSLLLTVVSGSENLFLVLGEMVLIYLGTLCIAYGVALSTGERRKIGRLLYPGGEHSERK
jgi:O-antigen/teichoic acid export membrane protein